MADQIPIPTDPRFKDIRGERFGRTVVVAYGGKSAAKCPQTLWICRCDCGTEHTVKLTHLRSGSTQSCGCLRKEWSATSHLRHGCARNGKRAPEYRAWEALRHRCLVPTDRQFHNYGGRGITVCDRWRDSFEAFLEDMGPRPSPKHSIDRWPDKNGNYEPGNCRWATSKQQLNNTRQNVLLTLNGRTQNLQQWADELGVTHSFLCNRKAAGWSDEDTLTRPPQRGRTHWIRRRSKETKSSPTSEI